MGLEQTRLVRLLSHALRSIELIGWRGTFVHFWGRTVSSFGRNGLAGTLQRTVREVPSPLAHQAPLARHPFDLLHGTDTEADARRRAVPGFFSNIYANGYLGIAPSALIQAIEHLPIRPEDFTFVDLGCGKGRAVMVAAQFPFRHILGVEISPELCAIVRSNIARNPAWAAKIEIREQDAASFTFPETPLVIFMYHPFLPPLLRRVLANLERQLRRNPRETWLVYADNPHYPKVFQRLSFLREVSEPEYPLSPEEAEAGHATHQRITIYSADLSR